MKPKLSAFSHLFILTLVEVAVDSWPFSLVNISYVQTVLKAGGWRGGGLWTPTQLFSGLRSSTPYVKTFRMSVQLSLISLSFFFFFFMICCFLLQHGLKKIRRCPVSSEGLQHRSQSNVWPPSVAV